MTLDEVKQYLRIDYEEENTYLQQLIEVSQIYIDSMVGEYYKTDAKAVKLATLLQSKLVSDMYSNRSTYIDKEKQDRIVTSILDKLSNYTEVV